MPSEEDSKIIKIYYDQASQHGLLSREEEIKLFKEYHKWKNNKSNCGSRARNKGKKARETLINSNLRLVIKIAKEFMG